MNFKRLAVHLVFLINLAAIGFLVVEAHSPPPATAHGTCADYPECAALTAHADESLDEQLAARFAPIVYLPALDKPCLAGGAGFAPVPVETVLGNPEVTLRPVTGAMPVVEAPRAVDLYRLGRKTYFTSYLDFPGSPLKPGCRYERDGLRFAAGHDSLAYARIVRDEEAEGLVLQYWFFYYFNDWNNKHEGDWELVQLYFETPNVWQALEDGPSSIGLSQHRSGEVKTWQGGGVAREGNRPVIYVARGSHANYFTPGLYLGRGEEGRGLGCDDASASTRRVPLAVQLLPAQTQGPRDPFAWVEYKGYWGEVRGRASEGSTAPATKQNWQHPFRWQDNLKSSSVLLPTTGLIGPDPARAFCNIVAFASDFLLPFYHDRPLLSIFAAGAISMGIFGTLANTRFLPARRQTLRSRRRLGQVLTSAFDIYLGNAYVFLTIALTAFPLGIILGNLGSLHLDAASILEPLPLSQAAPGRAAVAFVLGSLHAVFAGIVVVLASTAVVANMPGAGSRPVVRSWRQLPRLIWPRCAASGVAALLCLSVVGIPLAVRQTLRWAFLEQAMLVDGKSPRESFGASSTAVSGHSLWVAASLFVLSAIAFLVAPVIGISLIMTLKSLPTVYVSLASAAIYALVIPYVAISLTLVYFDLHSRPRT